MALFEEVLNGWGTPTLFGVGMIFVAPLLIPIVGAVVRPVAKTLIQGSLWVVDSVQALTAEDREESNDLIAEIHVEYHAGRATTPS